MDRRGKEVYINSTFSKLKDQAKKNDPKLKKEISDIY